MNQTKDIYQYRDVRDKILGSLDKLAKPVVQTLTPLGKNVIFQDELGNSYCSNDGYNILKNIFLEDPVENTIASIVKQASFRTNQLAGDGTTTSLLFADNLIRNGFRLIDNGWNQMDLKHTLTNVSNILTKEITKRSHKVKSNKDLEYIALVSSNNDPAIAKTVAGVVKKTGQDGLVFIEENNKSDLEVVEELGFVLDQGMFSPYCANVKGRFAAQYEDVVIFITDKRIYYEEEVLALLNTVAQMGENKFVVVAADFIGQAPNMFISNHANPNVNMNILLIKETDPEILDDLATYLGGQVVTEKRGSFVNALKPEDFARATKVLAEGKRTIITSGNDDGVALNLRIQALKKNIKEANEGSPEEKQLKKRLASLTNGITTLRVGGKTPAEQRENVYRYEDAINATRNALRDGYVAGGGITLYSIFQELDKSQFTLEIQDFIRRFCESPLKQIAENCNIHFDTMLKNLTSTVGYNAVTNKYEDLYEAGIIEPVGVLKSAVENAFSVAGVILSSDYLIINKPKKEDE